jgi:choice-of-anchor A domain-containing protein
MRNVLLAAAAVFAMALPAVASAETAADFNLFVLKDMAYRGSDTEGRVAVGGNANLTGYSVGDKEPASQVNLVVGGNLTTNGGSVKGKAIVGGTVSTTSYDASGIQPAGTPVPVNFASEGARLVALSSFLDTYANTGTVDSVCYGAPGSNGCQVTFNATAAGLNVFDIDTFLLSDTNTININLGAGSTVLINVSGTNVRLDGGMALNGGGTSQVLFNFHDATSFVVGNMDLRGSALAASAAYTGGGGVINGQLIVDSFTGDTWGGIGGTQINKTKFAGDLLTLTAPPVPEPTTWALMIAGFGMAGAMLRRRRSALAAA